MLGEIRCSRSIRITVHFHQNTQEYNLRTISEVIVHEAYNDDVSLLESLRDPDVPYGDDGSRTNRGGYGFRYDYMEKMLRR